MNWLIIQAEGIHPENVHLRECWSLKRAIESYGFNCDVVGKRHKEKVNYDKEYDVLLLIEQYEPEDIPEIDRIKAKFKLQWIIDLHCQTPAFYSNIGRHCHMVLHSTKSLINNYRMIASDKIHVWFPNGFDDFYMTGQGLNAEKILNIGFVGSPIPARVDFFDKVSSVVPIYQTYQIGQQMIDLIAKMKFHINRNIAEDINYRTFETIGIGTCLITDYNRDLETLGFVHEENCLMYRSKSDLIDMYLNYSGTNEWKAIAYRGHQLSKQHSYRQRVGMLLDILGGKNVFTE